VYTDEGKSIYIKAMRNPGGWGSQISRNQHINSLAPEFYI